MSSLPLISATASSPSPMRGFFIIGTVMMVGLVGSSILIADRREKKAAGEKPKMDPRMPAFIGLALIGTPIFLVALLGRIF